MNFIDPSDFQNLTSDLLAMINDEKMALTKFGNMSIKSLLAPFLDSFLKEKFKISNIPILPISIVTFIQKSRS